MANNNAHKPTQIESGHPQIGKPCLLCHDPLKVGETLYVCPRCKGVHHARCWSDNGGCARRGCPQLADVASTPPRAGTDPRPRVAGSWMLYVLGAVILILLGGTLGPVLLNRDHRPQLLVLLSAQEEQPAIDALAKTLNAQNDDLRVVFSVTPRGPLFQQKLVIMSAAGAPPDVIALPLFDLQYFAEQGALLPLDQLAADPALSRLPAARIKLGRVGAHAYGIPDPGAARFFAVTKNAPHADAAVALIRSLATELPIIANLDDVAASERLKDQLRQGGGLQITTGGIP